MIPLQCLSSHLWGCTGKVGLFWWLDDLPGTTSDWLRSRWKIHQCFPCDVLSSKPVSPVLTHTVKKYYIFSQGCVHEMLKLKLRGTKTCYFQKAQHQDQVETFNPQDWDKIKIINKTSWDQRLETNSRPRPPPSLSSAFVTGLCVLLA